VTYWGDLTSHGFAILNQLRARGVDATSALMEMATLFDHRDLWGSIPIRTSGCSIGSRAMNAQHSNR
jgi:hypothetical protein